MRPIQDLRPAIALAIVFSGSLAGSSAANSALRFAPDGDGIVDFVQVPASASLNGLGRDMTIEFRVRTLDPHGGET